MAKKEDNAPKRKAKKTVKKTAKKASAAPKTRKTAAKKTAKPKTVKAAATKPAARQSAPKTPLKKAELEYFRGLLMEKLREILGDVDWIESEALKKSRMENSGDLSHMPIHMADIGTDNYEQEFSLGLMDSERKIVREILDAIKRIERGTYGICEGTGQPIPKPRLEANPWARYCVEYASLIEQGKAPAHPDNRTWNFMPVFGPEEEDEEEDEEAGMLHPVDVEADEEEEEETDVEGGFFEELEEEDEPKSEEDF